MQAIIMAGGMGVRLRPLTFSIPKPLIPVGEKPILEMIISRLKKHGIKDIILAVGYKSDLIKAYFEDGKKFGVNITYFLEEKKLGTAGPLKIISGKEDISDPVLVMNGDIVTELDFDKLINFHKSKKSDFTVATKKHEYKSPFGVIKTESDKVISLEEKPVIKFDVSAGIYIMNKDILELVPTDSFYDIPDLINLALEKKKNVLSYEIKEYWLGIEDIKNLGEASQELMKHEIDKADN